MARGGAKSLRLSSKIPRLGRSKLIVVEGAAHVHSLE